MAWHDPTDFNCELCDLKPALREIKGCHGPSEGTYVYPPPSVTWHDERTEVNVCPVRLMTGDLYDLARAYNLADGRLALDEQQELPAPYLAGWDLLGYHMGKAQAERMRKIANG